MRHLRRIPGLTVIVISASPALCRYGVVYHSSSRLEGFGEGPRIVPIEVLEYRPLRCETGRAEGTFAGEGEGDVRCFHGLFGLRPSDFASLRASSIAALTDAGFIAQSRASPAIDSPPSSSARKKNPLRATA